MIQEIMIIYTLKHIYKIITCIYIMPFIQHSKTLKKYKDRKSPPYPANKNCNKK